jgi:hypothetical protein
MLRIRDVYPGSKFFFIQDKIGLFGNYGTCPDETNPVDDILPPSADESSPLHHVVMSAQAWKNYLQRTTVLWKPEPEP